MTIEEMKRIWECQKFETSTDVSPAEQIASMRLRLKMLDRGTLLVDAVIILISIGLITFFGRSFAKTVSPVSRVGLAMIMGTIALWIWEPIHMRRAFPPPSADASVTEWLTNELKKVRAQARSRRYRRWSVLLLCLGEAIMAWGLAFDLATKIRFASVFIVANALIYVVMLKLNRYTARKADEPLMEELESMIKANDS